MNTIEADNAVAPAYAAATEQAGREASRIQPRPTNQVANKAVVNPAEQAKLLNEVAAASYLCTATAAALGADVETLKHYLDNFLAASGNPTDPVEKMLLEQLAISHHAIGILQAQAATCQNLESARMYHGAVTRLMAEFRRHALALASYRERTRVAGLGEHQSARPTNGCRKKKKQDTELVSNRLTPYLSGKQN